MVQSKSLAITSFMSDPDDTLATPDVYNIDSGDVINNLPKISDSQIAEENKLLEDGMRGGAAMAEGLPLKKDSLLSGGASLLGGASASSSGLLTKAKDAASGALNAIGGIGGLAKIAGAALGPSLLTRLGAGSMTGIPGLSGTNLTSLASTLAGNAVPGGFSKSLNAPIVSNLGSVASFGGASSLVAPGNLLPSYQMGSVLNNVMGGSNPMSIVDKDSSVRLISSLASSAMSAGIPKSFSQVSSLAGGNSSILSQAAGIVLKSASSSGNIAGMRDVTSVFPGPGGASTLFAGSPNVLTDASRNYKKPLPIGTTVYNGPAVSQDYTDTMDTFSSINPSWKSTDRLVPDPTSQTGGMITETSLNINVLRNGNDDFKNMMTRGAMQSSVPEEKFMVVASAFPSSSPESSLRSSFPQTVTSVKSDTQAQMDAIDARIAQNKLDQQAAADRAAAFNAEAKRFGYGG